MAMSVWARCGSCRRVFRAPEEEPWTNVCGACSVVKRPHKLRHEKRRAVLKNWSLVDKCMPGLRLSLMGDVYGHEKFYEGESIQTSPLLRLDIPAREAETLNTVYLLG